MTGADPRERRRLLVIILAGLAVALAASLGFAAAAGFLARFSTETF